ncbi:LysR substrate-binding domain-containing protein [Vibrio breoganii]
MEFKNLKSFVAVATHLSFSRAAKELNTVQPAISRHITALEDELDTKLFFRTSREVSLTVAGERLFQDAGFLLSQVEQTKQAVVRASKGQVGRLSIGYLGGATLFFLPRLVRSYIQSHADIDVNLIELTASGQIEALLDKRIDISFSRPLPEQFAERFISKEVYKDKLVLVVSRDHPLAQQPSIKLNQLREEPFILFARESAVGLYDSVIKECQLSGFSPRIVNSPRQMQTVLTHVASGLGVSIVPSSVRDLRSNECVFLPIEHLQSSLQLVMSYRQHNTSPMIEDFVELVEQDLDTIKQHMSR